MRRIPHIIAPLTLLFLGIFLLSAIDSFAQSKKQRKKIVQFTGVIVADDGITQVPGVHIYVPSTGRGTTTNVYGYFSMPALVGDRVVISAIGFLRQEYSVPDGHNSRVNVLFKLEEDTLYLENVDISPYLSEKQFKEAILALNIPDNNKMLEGRLDGAAMAMMLRGADYDASLNARYYFDQQYYYQQDNYGPRSNPFLNPFNWSRFIKDLKKK